LLDQPVAKPPDLAVTSDSSSNMVGHDHRRSLQAAGRDR
jgi:hypothetical protein